ncbi:hypothetical protein P9E76_03860 [Schinkia azotoformans]|nr:hypothetical protein [Schinkia azotoformans]MEC1639769.1 hypothetical protein [Schinkia azotoformans]MEC1722719.1 hypothetical protein [Schinkia azotoformans]MEC1944204.1 hypothetical protein [Schinkia azotoformans]MED4354286.1 hypothetical protein [Schinkia azotoformans]MED4415747.1 hypothetical protein [Schinkia azotoformans]
MDCIIFEESALAHCLYHLLEEKKISLDDDISKIDLNQADHEKVAEMFQKNVLGFHKVGLYSLKMDQTAFVFIYARSQEEAIQFFIKSFHSYPLNCHEYPLEFEITRGKEVLSFREMKKEFKRFPAMAGSFLKGK